MTTVILPEDVVKLEVEIKRLTIENQQLRETLRDKFAMAVTPEILRQWHTEGHQFDAVKRIWRTVDAILEVRNE